MKKMLHCLKPYLIHMGEEMIKTKSYCHHI